MNKLVYVLSDLHLGPGKDPATRDWVRTEDFRFDDAFVRFIGRISMGPQPVELVIAGDFIEYPQILPELALSSPEDDLGCSEEESLRRTEVVLGRRPDVASGHPAIFQALRRFISAGNTVTLLVGNHDVELFWPQVWDLLTEAICPRGARGALLRRPFSYTVGSASRGRVYIEHGQEHDPSNRYGLPDAPPFGEDRYGVRRIQRCWGTLFVDKVFNQLEPTYWFIDNIKPQTRALQLGLRNNIGFTAQALLMVLRFLLTSSPPIGDVILSSLDNEVEQLDQRSVDRLAENLADDDVRSFLHTRRDDSDFYGSLEQDLSAIAEGEWRRLRQGLTQRLTLERLAPMPPNPLVEQAAPAGLAEARDAYMIAARAAMERDPRIGTVVMGHTHTPVDGRKQPLRLRDGRSGLYFNTGTWTPLLRNLPGVVYSWSELSDPSNYASVKTYVALTPDPEGAYRAELRVF